MRAGLDIARLWLRGPSEVFTIQASALILSEHEFRAYVSSLSPA